MLFFLQVSSSHASFETEMEDECFKTKTKCLKEDRSTMSILYLSISIIYEKIETFRLDIVVKYFFKKIHVCCLNSSERLGNKHLNMINNIF